MTLLPGEQMESEIEFSMHQGMDGPHEFRVHIFSNDPVEPDKQVVILSNWVP